MPDREFTLIIKADGTPAIRGLSGITGEAEKTGKATQGAFERTAAAVKKATAEMGAMERAMGSMRGTSARPFRSMR